MLEDKTSTQTIFCCRLPEVVFQNLLVVFRFHDFFDSDENPSSKRTETSPQHYTDNSIFHCGNGVLWVEHLSLLIPNIGNISMAKELYFCLIRPKDTFLVFFSRLSFKLQSSLEVSLLQKRSFSWSSTTQSIPARASSDRLH